MQWEREATAGSDKCTVASSQPQGRILATALWREMCGTFLLLVVGVNLVVI
jgi:hypothetical protein